MKYLLKIVALTIFASSAFAAQPSTSHAINLSSGNDTPYAQLKELYLAASAPASLSDFQPASSKISQQCVVVSQDNQNSFLPEFAEVLTSGNEQKLYLGNCDGDTAPCDQATAQKSFDFLTMELTSSDLISTNTNPDLVGTPMQVLFRKAGGYIYFAIVETSASSSGGPIFQNPVLNWVGYCWNP